MLTSLGQSEQLEVAPYGAVLQINHDEKETSMIIELGNVSEETKEVAPIGGLDDKHLSHA
jgi:hypothetical protein